MPSIKVPPPQKKECSQWTVYFSSNFDSCPERLCEGMGQILRKDDSFENALAIYMNYLSTVWRRQCCGSKYIAFGSGSRILAQF